MCCEDCGLTGLTFSRPSLVKPQFAADCDLSNIVRKFVRTGELPVMHQRPNIGDADGYPQSFQELQDNLAYAKSKFESLPEKEREKYLNDVENWLESQLKEMKNESQNAESSEEHSEDDTPIAEEKRSDKPASSASSEV